MSTMARQLMRSEPLTIAAETPLREVLHLFVVAQIRSAPVVDQRGVVLGMIAASDLLGSLDELFDEDVDEGEEADAADSLAKLVAKDVTAPSPPWVTPDTPVARVASLMRREGVHAVLVGSGGRLDGILTTFDLLGAIAE